MRFGLSGLVALIFSSAACDQDIGITTYDNAPVAAIKQPFDGAIFSEGETITFVGKLADDRDVEELGTQWISDLDQALTEESAPDPEGLTTYVTANLQSGNHVITLWAIDAAAQTSTASITITVVDQPEAPDVTIVHPAPGETGTEGEEFEFVATVYDLQDDPSDLLVIFESDLQGELCQTAPDATGVASCDVVMDEAGDHQITATAFDTDDLQDEATVYMAVVSLQGVDNDNDGFTEDQGDCDDDDPYSHPGATELKDRADNDCDGEYDEGTDWYDDDGDGYCEELVVPCTDGSLNGDCDDTQPAINPAAPEICFDPYDNNCSGTMDETGALGCFTYYLDADHDNYGDPSASACLCAPAGQWTATNGNDCDDTNIQVNPTAPEAPDRLDNNCNGEKDEGTIYYDDDGDGYCDSNIEPCTLQNGQLVAWDNGDCNDTTALVSPAAQEVCFDSIDNDCSGYYDDGVNAVNCFSYNIDGDQDGFGGSGTACYCDETYPYTENNSNDCYDSNASTHPGQTGFFGVHRGDGGFDYDCNGTEEKQDTRGYDCGDLCVIGLDSVDQGWKGGTPTCGSTGSWVTDCYWDWFSCEQDTVSKQQLCR